jgi:ligand-binding SRPBCC domain-containing protein
MQLRFEQYIEQPAPVLFAFHADPRNLGVLLDSWPGFRLLHLSGHIRPGAQTWVEQMIAGFIPLVMAFRHTIYEPPHRFAEELFHGPFRRFAHIHEFEPSGSGTIVRDLLDIQLPWYYGGETGVRLGVAPAFRRFFAFRHQALQRLVARGALTADAPPRQLLTS